MTANSTNPVEKITAPTTNDIVKPHKAWVTTISKEFKLTVPQVQSLFELVNSNYDIPYLAKFETDKIGSQNEYTIHKIIKRQKEIQSLEEKKNKTIKFFDEAKKSSPELTQAIKACSNKTEVNDIYLPHQPGKQSKGTNALAAGLKPLAELLLTQSDTDKPLDSLASEYLNPEKNLTSPEQVLENVRALMAESIAERADTKKVLRRYFNEHSRLSSKATPKGLESKSVYEEYYDFEAPLRAVTGIKYLAIQRGERQKFLNTIIVVDDDAALKILTDKIITTENPALKFQLESVISDAYHKFLRVELQNEIKQKLWERSQDTAMTSFTQSFAMQLMHAKLGAEPIVAIHPGQEAGCGVAFLDSKGTSLDSTLLFFHDERKDDAFAQFKDLIAKHSPKAIALGSGDFSKETKAFVTEFLTTSESKLPLIIMSAPEALTYVSSDKGKQEFPEDSLSSINAAHYIGRKMQDPLAELVKIDPLTLNLGPYQKDVDQQQLLRRLKNITEITVSKVCPNVNKASADMLQYVAGLNLESAHIIGNHIKSQTKIASKEDFKSIEGLEDITIKQAELFLSFGDQESKADPRPKLEILTFDPKVKAASDFKQGAKLKGRVTNFTPYGIFVDIGLDHDALIHRSQVPEKWNNNYSRVFKLGQTLHVTIKEVDAQKDRVQLSLSTGPSPSQAGQRRPQTDRPHKSERASTKKYTKPARLSNVKGKGNARSKPQPKQSLGTLADQFKGLLNK